MRLFSASEYEFGLLAVGSAPIGVVALGLAPIGVVSIGIMPVGLLTFACGGSLGVVNFVCGAGLGAFVRGVGVAIGGDAEAVGVQLSLTGNETKRDRSSHSYWIRVGIVAALVLLLLSPIAVERLAVTNMDRVARAAWRVHPSSSEGIYVAPDSECRVDALMRSDGRERLHVDLSLTCGSLLLVERRLRDGCTVEQLDEGRASPGGPRALGGGEAPKMAYNLRCNAEHIPERESEDDVEPEVPGLFFDSIASPGSASVRADGPPPMLVQLRVDSPSEAISGGPLLLPGMTELTGERGSDWLQFIAE